MRRQGSATIRFWLLAAACAPALCLADSGLIDLKTLRTHSRLIFKLDASTTTDWKDEGQGFTLTLKGIGLADLGAPLGEEDRFKSIYEGMADSRLSGLRFEEGYGEVKVRGRWKFPKGPNAPAVPKMETFYYYDRANPRLIVDFWLKDGPTAAQVKAASLRAKRVAALKKSEDFRKKRITRRLATEAKRRDLEDVTLFCRQPLSDDNSVFLKLRPFHSPVDFSRWIPKTSADSEFSYFEPKDKDKASDYVRIALKFYREGKFALVLKTLDFFDKDVRLAERKPFAGEMAFLKSNAMLKLGLTRDALDLLEDIKREHRDNLVALHSTAFLAARALGEGNALGALGHFQWLTQQYPKHEMNWLFHLGIAESLYRLKETERAEKEYQWVAENAPNPQFKAQGALRIGDLFMDRGAYEQALAAYFQGLNYFGPQARDFPAIFINRAETLYQLGQYDEATKAFHAFLTEHPQHPVGWRATFRIAEVHGRKDGDAERDESRKWFYDTINRYPSSAGATLARTRLIPCGDHAGLDTEAQERFFNGESKTFDGQGEVLMTNYQDFRSIAYVRALINYGKQNETVNVAIENIRQAKSASVKRILGSVLASYFRKTVLSQLAEGKKYEALAFYQEKFDRLPKDLPQVDPDYLLRLSQAAADLGFGKMGTSLMDEYKRALKPRPVEGRAVASLYEPATEQEAQERLAEEAFTEAKSLWISEGAAKANEVAALLTRVPEESPASFEREVILGLIEASKKGRAIQAIARIQKAMLLKRPDLDSESLMRLEAWLGTMEADNGSPENARALFAELEKKVALSEKDRTPAQASLVAALGVPAVPSRVQLILSQAELSERLEKWGDAASAYSRAMDAKLGGNRAAFGFARSLIKSGDAAERVRAFQTLKEISESKTDDFWRKLAREMLANEKSANIAKEGKS